MTKVVSVQFSAGGKQTYTPAIDSRILAAQFSAAGGAWVTSNPGYSKANLDTPPTSQIVFDVLLNVAAIANGGRIALGSSGPVMLAGENYFIIVANAGNFLMFIEEINGETG